MALRLFRRSLFSALNQPNTLSNSTIYLYLLNPFPYSYYSTTTLKPEQANPSIANFLIQSHSLSPDTASTASFVLARLKSLDKAESIIKYLKDIGFSTSQLDSLLKRTPTILLSNLDSTIKPKVQVLQDLGIPDADIVELISADPYILSRDVDNQLGRSIISLKSILGSEADVVRVLKVSTSFLKYNLDRTMVPNIEFLRSCGVSKEQIIQFMFNFPRLFLYKPETMNEYVRRVDEMGLSRSSKMFLHAVRVISSMSEENWKSKLDVFRGLGFTEEDILSVFRKSPQVFAASERKIKEVSDILISATKHDPKVVVKYPDLLLCSVRQRLLPRLKVINALEAKKLIKRRPGLRTFLKASKGEFIMKYVDPYADAVGELYTASQGSS